MNLCSLMVRCVGRLAVEGHFVRLQVGECERRFIDRSTFPVGDLCAFVVPGRSGGGDGLALR